MVVVIQMVQQMVQQQLKQQQIIEDVVQINDIIIIVIIIRDVLQFVQKDVHLQQQQQQYQFHQLRDVFISMNTKRIYINHAKVRVQIVVIHLQFVLLIKNDLN